MKLINYLFLGVFLFIFCLEGYSESEAPKNIIIIYDGDGPYFKKAINQIKEETKALLKERCNFLPDLSGNWDIEKIQANVERVFQDENVDTVIAIGFLSATYLLGKEAVSKPTIIADAIDEQLALNYSKDGRSLIPNLTFLSVKETINEEIALLKALFPFRRLGVLVSPVFTEYTPALKESIERNFAIDVEIIFYKDDSKKVIDEIKKKKVEAVYITPPAVMGYQYLDDIIKALNKNKLPTLSMFGYVDVERGVLAGYIPKFFTKYSRRIALIAERIVEGESPNNIDINFALETYPFINARTANKLGISIPFELLLDAEIIDRKEARAGEVLSMKKAVEGALENNFLFRVKEQEIEEAKQEHRSYWSAYFPSIYGNLEYTIQDPTQFPVSLGITPQKKLEASLTVNQLIFSDSAITSIKNSKISMEIEKLEKKVLDLDITEETIKAYLNYLKAKALLNTQERHLKTVKYYLRTAKTKVDVGIGTKEDVLRWRSEEAEAKSEVLYAQSQLRIARNLLNKLMNIDQERPFIEQEVSLEMLNYYIGGERILVYLTDFKKLEIFLDFLVNNAMRDSYTLQTLRLGISAQKNVKKVTLRKFILPEISAQGSFTHVVNEQYSGSDTASAVRQLGSDLGLGGGGQENEWVAVLKLSYPIFEGGQRFFDYSKEKAALERLLFEYKLKEQDIEFNVREAAYSLYYSWPKIHFSFEALKNSSDSLAVIQEKYAKGIASITDLIEAEDDRFGKEQTAAISIYEFLDDLTSLDRQLTHFSYLESEESRIEFFQRVQEHFALEGIEGGE